MKKIILALLLILALVSTSEGQRNLRKIQRGNPTGSGDPLRSTAGGSPPASGGTPTLSSATIATTGKTVSLVFSESVTIGAGGNGGVVITPTHANWNNTAVVSTYASGSGSTTLVYNLDRYVTSVETGTIAYTQPGNGIEATTGGGDVANFSGTAITNSSTVPVPDVYYKCEDNAANTTWTATYGSNGASYQTSGSSSNTADNTSTTAFKGSRSSMPASTGGFFYSSSLTEASLDDGEFTVQIAYYGTGSFASGYYPRIISDANNEATFRLISNNASDTSFLISVGGTEVSTVTLDDINTSSWTVIRVVVNTAAASNKVVIYQGTSETGMTAKYSSGATSFGTPNFVTNTNWNFGGNGETNKNIQAAGGRIDEVKIWYTSVTP